VSYPDPTKKYRHASTRSGSKAARAESARQRAIVELPGYYSDGRAVNLAEALRREAR